MVGAKYGWLVLGLLIVLSSCSKVMDDLDLSVTIYSNNFAMVKDLRKVKLDKGESELTFRDVAETIRPETVSFQVGDNGVHVYSQRQTSGSLTSQGLSQEQQYGTSSGKNLVWRVDSPKEIVTDWRISYRATGFEWKADYTLIINSNAEKADFLGWVTIDNNSRKTYRRATLKLVAGNLNIVSVQPSYYGFQFAAPAEAPARPISENSLSDYHVYTFQRKMDVNESSVQLQFVPRIVGVAVDKYYSFTINAGGYTEENIQARGTVRFANSMKNQMGLPLPKGIVRVLQADETGDVDFVGQDSIPHTPSQENITLQIGTAFDVVAKKVSTHRLNLANQSGYDATLRLEVINRGSTSKQFRIELSNPSGDNNVIRQSRSLVTSELPWKKQSSTRYVSAFKVDAGAKHIVEWAEEFRG